MDSQEAEYWFSLNASDDDSEGLSPLEKNDITERELRGCHL